MSRYTAKRDNGVEVFYGHDHAVGYFIQRFENDELVYDIDMMMNSRSDVIDKMKEEGIPENHFNCVLSDLPF